jgi:exopolysaccharide production protein ExoQ
MVSMNIIEGEFASRLNVRLALFLAVIPLGAGAAGAGEGSTLRQLAWSMIFISAAFVWLRSARFEESLRGTPASLLALIIYCIVSVIWSEDPSVSAKRVIQIVGVFVVALSFVWDRFNRNSFENSSKATILFIILLATSFSFAFSSFAFSENGLRAFMATKNNYGQFLAFASILFLANAIGSSGLTRRMYVTITIVALVQLGMTRSMTAIVALVVIWTLLSVYWLSKKVHPSWLVPALVVTMFFVAFLQTIAIAYGIPSFSDVVAGSATTIGRDITLSGRVYLWELMFDQISRHPFFGTGYGAFWLGLSGDSGQIAYLVKWGYPGQAHNGYIDVINELGIVGFVILLWLMIDHGRRLISVAKRSGKVALFHAMIFGFVIVSNLAEAIILRTTHVLWIVAVISIVEVAKIERSHRIPNKPLKF